MKVSFSQPLPDKIIVNDGVFSYLLVSSRPYTRKDGVESRIAAWLGECADCGEEYIFEASAFALPQRRRCDEHKNPKVRTRQKTRGIKQARYGL